MWNLKKKKGKMSTDKYINVSDDEFVRVCSDVVNAFCRERYKFGPIDESTCRGKADDAFKTAYRNALGYKRSDALKQEHLWEMNEIYTRLQSRIYQAVREIILKFAAKDKTLSIKKTSADAVIRAALQDAGFTDCYTLCQCYRVKATVRYRRYKATIIVKYKDILAGKLDECVQDFKETVLKLESAPYEVKICR